MTGFDGFLSMMGAVGDVQVDSPLAFTTEDGDVQVRRGPNTFDADEALSYARTRETLPGGSDFERAANHQRLLLGVLERLRERRGRGRLHGGGHAVRAGRAARPTCRPRRSTGSCRR